MQKALVMQKSANIWQVQFLASVSTVENEKDFAMSWKQNSCANLERAALHSFSRRREETWCLWMAESHMYQFWIGNLMLLHLFPSHSHMSQCSIKNSLHSHPFRGEIQTYLFACFHAFEEYSSIRFAIKKITLCSDRVPQQSFFQKCTLVVLWGLVSWLNKFISAAWGRAKFVLWFPQW